ncbi:MAG TPA: NADH-quinone oxidoreductase subunit NuoE [Armatimonadota bacterium]|nr:NADH-quinone oxidoreductase subunit NuoE [Armatimonadota bacterium]
MFVKGVTSVETCETCKDNALYQQLDQVMAQYGHSPDSLIQVLHEGQGIFGYLPDEVLRYISRGLKVPISKVYGVVTFYSFFSTVPKGKHTIMVCLGTACYVKGSERILSRLKSELGIDLGETTEDLQFTLSAARCVGACGLAPVAMVDEDVYGRLTPDKVAKIVKKYRA